MPGGPVRVVLSINGRAREVFAGPHETLLEVLREYLGLTGTKHGCELGECGACTVLVDGAPALACLTLPVELIGRDITTIEGLGEPAGTHPLQREFAARGAAQCGYCTGGILLTASALLAEGQPVDEAAVRSALSGNLCRCTGYAKIVEAVMVAAQMEPRA